MAWSSRRNAVEALLLLPLVAGATLGCRGTAREHGPVLVLSSSAPAPDEALDAATVKLALGSLAPNALDELVDLLDEGLTALETKANPLLIDVLDGDHRDRWAASVARFLPMLNAAREFVRGAWSSSDGLSVRVERRGDVRGGRTIPAWPAAGAGERTDQRARFLAWPVSYARLLQAPDPLTCERLAGLLREQASRPEAMTGLVLDQASLAGTRRFDELARVVRDRRRLLARAKGDPAVAGLATLVDPGEPRRVAGWLDLSPRELLVVPRLSALARDREFGQYVMRVAGAVDPRVTIANRVPG